MRRMSVLQTLLERARERPARIVFPEAGDARVLAAVRRLAAEKIVEPVLVDIDISPAGYVVRQVDLRYPGLSWKAGQIVVDKRPVRAAIARDLNVSVIGAHPDDIGLQLRFTHR